MVFFVIACIGPDKDEDKAGQVVQSVLGTGPRALGELY